MENPFSWDYLTAPVRETEMFGPFSIFYVGLFVMVFLVSAMIFASAPRRLADHKLNRDTMRRFATWLMWSSAMALFFFGVRATQTPLLTLEKRIWMYLSFLAFLIVLGLIVRHMRSVYPAQLAAFDRSRERRAWQHAARRPGGQTASRKGQPTRTTRAQTPARKRRTAR